MPGRVTATSVGAAGSVESPVSASGATSPAGSVMAPPGPDVVELGEQGRRPARCGDGQLDGGRTDHLDGVRERLAVEGRELAGDLDASCPPMAAPSAPRPGTVVIAAGVPPAGVTTGWTGPLSLSACRWAGSVPSSPG